MPLLIAPIHRDPVGNGGTAGPVPVPIMWNTSQTHGLEIC